MKSKFLSAALTGLVLASTSAVSAKTTEKSSTTMGECHGANACKGQGECGGNGNSCGGSNSCKGQGWKTMTKKDCDKKKGQWKTMTAMMHGSETKK